MIGKLRKKFILLATSALVLVLLIAMLSVNLIHYHQNVRQTDELLDILIDTDGAFPMMESEDAKTLEKLFITPETPYFAVVLNSRGEVSNMEISRVAAINTSTAVAYAKKISDSDTDCGYEKNYRYKVRRSSEETRIVFLDCTKIIASVKWMLAVSGVVALLVAGVFFFLISALSHRIVHPIAESYIKQRQFITDAGHEIKTPISIINADIDVLEMEIGKNDWLRDIKKQAARLTSLTKDLIYLSKMEEDRPGLQKTDCLFSDLTEDVARSFQSLAKAQNKAFHIDIQPMLAVRGDAKALAELVTILLDNALKYSSENGEITLHLALKNHMAVLSVSNFVDQISETTLRHMFDRFYRGDQSRNSESGGYGIGLSIAQAIVHSHKGEIRAAAQSPDLITITASIPGHRIPEHSIC